MTNNQVRTDRLDLLSMTPEFMEALVRGDREAAQQMVGYLIPANWPEGDESTLQYRVDIARAQPEAVPLLLRAMVLLADPKVMVGRIGFHGAADEAGILEIGYKVFPEHRRQGYAREAAVAMLGWAGQDPAVRTFRASVSPDNLASRNLVTSLGFVEVGSQWDDEDGEETVYERVAGQV